MLLSIQADGSIVDDSVELQSSKRRGKKREFVVEEVDSSESKRHCEDAVQVKKEPVVFVEPVGRSTRISTGAIERKSVHSILGIPKKLGQQDGQEGRQRRESEATESTASDPDVGVNEKVVEELQEVVQEQVVVTPGPSESLLRNALGTAHVVITRGKEVRLFVKIDNFNYFITLGGR